MLLSASSALSASAQSALKVTSSRHELKFQDAAGVGTVRAPSDSLIRVRYSPSGVKAVPTEVLDSKSPLLRSSVGLASGESIETGHLKATIVGQTLTILLPSGTIKLDLAKLGTGTISLTRPSGEHLYGMRGIGLHRRIETSVLRDSGAHVAASAQGDGGAPFAFTPTWGVFIDSVDGDFSATPNTLSFSHGSRKDVDLFIFSGPPLTSMSSLAGITGRPPLPPKWTLGFMNSQWGLTQPELESIVEGYRSRQIPLDGFIFDFDFKAWGEDNYGEFRWNSTSAPGNVSPDKFPDGANGKLAKDMAAKGVKFVGIMKPRVIVTTTQGTPTDAARDGDANHWFLPWQKPYPEYFSGRLANDIDFTTRAARHWFWSHAKGLFQTGIQGWWNDEADEDYNSLGFFDMQRALYEGQRSVSDRRVWSINRNFYLGAQKYAFGTWSGDISTGFENMKTQTARMIASLNLGQPHWSMDTGGFNGHPSPENYARWMEFAALVPIMRVHGTYGEKRQPWVYGPVAEAAAKSAIELRYRFLPTLYDLEYQASQTGVGIVRPLFWEFPNDPNCADLNDEWMIGDSILAAPVLQQGATTRRVYLPPGTWESYDSGVGYEGGTEITVPVDSAKWSDIPIFIRKGTILTTQPVEQYVDQHPPETVQLDLWPGEGWSAAGEFYDDDGVTYGYSHGAYRLQRFHLKTLDSRRPRLTLSSPTGRFSSKVKNYRIVLHGLHCQRIQIGNQNVPFDVSSQSFLVPAWQELKVDLIE